MTEERCPRCFSRISGFATGESSDWTDDPILTPKGEAGDDYKGFTDIKPIHIQELQTLRAQQEIEAGIAEEDRTEFTEINTENNLVNFYRTHLLELRESTEKILTAFGQTKDIYFNYDEDGTEYNIGNHQTDWKDPNLAERTNKFVNIKAVHIEDLRHFLIVTAWFDDFTGITPTDVKSVSGSASANVSQGEKDADFQIYYPVLTTDNLIDNKMNLLPFYRRGRVRAKCGRQGWTPPGIGWVEGIATADANHSQTITQNKPVRIQMSNSASVYHEHDITDGDYEGSGINVAASASGIARITWQDTKFELPEGHPNILLTDDLKLYLDITGTWSSGIWNYHRWYSGSYEGNSYLESVGNMLYLKVIFRYQYLDNPPLPQTYTYYIHSGFLGGIDDVRPYVYIPNTFPGQLILNLREDIIASHPTWDTPDVKLYFCNEIELELISSVSASLGYLHIALAGRTSASASNSADITISKIGLKSVP